MKRLLFLVSAVALASALPAGWRAFSLSSANGWSELGDGLLFWLKWASNWGGKHLLVAAFLALGLVAVARRPNSSNPLSKLLTTLVDIFAHPISVVLCLALALLPHVMVVVKTPDTSKKPDVIFILLDTVRLDHMGWGGSELETTPKLDALAHQGAAFTQAIAQAPWTRPSIGTLMTGQVPGFHGATARLAPLPKTKRTMAEAFAAAGYRTAGYSSNPNITPLFDFNQGFQTFATDTTAVAETFVTSSEDWIRAGNDQASFLYLHLNDAHYPYEPLPGYEGLFNHSGVAASLDGAIEAKFRESLGVGLTPKEVESLRLSYAEEIRYLDDQVGDFVTRQLASNDNLLIVICSDHGEEFFEHGDVGHGHSLHDELIRVPLQFAWSPALGERLGFKPGIHQQQVRHLDVLPTLLEVTGLVWPLNAQELQGESLGNSLRREDPGPPRVAFSETDSMGSPLSGPAGPLRSWRTPNEKLIVTDPWFEATAGRVWLYNLVVDFEERNNLASSHVESRKSLWQQLLDSGLMIERSHIAPKEVKTTTAEQADLNAMGYSENHLQEQFGEAPYFDPRAVKWVEIAETLPSGN